MADEEVAPEELEGGEELGEGEEEVRLRPSCANSTCMHGGSLCARPLLACRAHGVFFLRRRSEACAPGSRTDT